MSEFGFLGLPFSLAGSFFPAPRLLSGIARACGRQAAAAAAAGMTKVITFLRGKVFDFEVERVAAGARI